MDRVLGVLSLVTTLIGLVSSSMGEVKLLQYTQQVDHFGNDQVNLTFQQRLWVDDTRWGGAKAGAPIFVLFGSEDGFLFPPTHFAILNLSAVRLNAMLVHIEHRFYGGSIPLNAIDLAMADHRVRRCLATDQVLQDFAVIIQSLKTNYSCHNSPVIVVGVGYSGALATWFRLKYPEITIGALASSTPLLYYGNSTTPADGYCSIVSKVYQETSSTCHDSIRKSWRTIDEIASKPNGLGQLSQIFNTCRPFSSAEDLKQRLGQFLSIFAQYDLPTTLAVQTICHHIDSSGGSINAIAGAVWSKIKTGNCLKFNITNAESPFDVSSSTSIAWTWQRCSELIFPVGCNEPTMLPTQPFDFARFEDLCRKRFGTISPPHSPISFFGTHDILKALKFGGNIIFSNGLKDPLSSGSILEDVSETIIALTTTQGTYCLDTTSQDEYDPKWVVDQREEELRLFTRWINYYHHIRSYSNGSGPYYNHINLCLFSFLLFISIYLG